MLNILFVQNEADPKPSAILRFCDYSLGAADCTAELVVLVSIVKQQQLHR